MDPDQQLTAPTHPELLQADDAPRTLTGRGSSRELETTSELMDAVVARCSSDLHYLWVNRRFADWIGLPRDAIIGRSIEEIVGAAAFGELKPHFDKVLSGEALTYDQEIGYSTIGKRWIHAAYVPTRDDAGLVNGWVAVLSDITAAKHVEIELLEAYQRSEDFMAMMAHELRGPLTALTHGLAIMRASTPAPTPPALCDMLQRQVTQLTRLICDLQEAGRIHNVALQRSRVDLTEIVPRAIEDCRALLESRRIRTELDVRARPVVVQGDPDRLTQVFMNLIGNGAKFTPPGGRINLTVESVGAHALVQVADSGIGIDRNELEAIFGLYARGRQARLERHPGFGIGLCVVRTLVEMHGGAVWAQSDGCGHGSTFLVRLPAGLPSIEPRPATPACTSGTAN